MLGLAILAYLAKLPVSVAWNLFMLFIFSIELLLRNLKRAWDPRTWITIGVFYVIGTLAITFLVQIPLDLLALTITGKTLTGLIPSTGSWLSNYAISSFISVSLFTILLSKIVAKLMHPAEKAKIFRKDVMESIIEYNNEYVVSKAKKAAIIFLLGLVLALIT